MDRSTAFSEWKRSGGSESFVYLFNGQCRAKCVSIGRRFISRSTNLSQDLEDVLQSVRTKLIAKRADIVDTDHFEGLACTYARRFGKRKLNELRAFSCEIDAQNLSAPVDILEQLLEAELRTYLNDAVELLSEKHRVVFRLVVLEQLSICEAAEVLGVNEDTVTHRRDYARRKVLEFLRIRMGEAV